MIDLNLFYNAIEEELSSILNYWMANTLDNEYGGFAGRIDQYNAKEIRADKGIVLNARILYTFSSAYRLSGETNYLDIARRAFEYITTHFIDKDFGGVYWMLNHKGEALDEKKQTYGIAFTIYGLSEYYLAAQDNQALETAIELYQLIVKHTFDSQYGGYIEATSRDWSPISDVRLSEKDANAPKSMNTHLHVIEAFSNLYLAWPDEVLKTRISELLELFATYIFKKDQATQDLFFALDWSTTSDLTSPGHDIEASWLLEESARIIDDAQWLSYFRKLAIKTGNFIEQFIDADGGLWYEKNQMTGHLNREKHWWPQAEAVVGYYILWRNTNDSKYMSLFLKVWSYIIGNMKDMNYGEWYWGRQADGEIMKDMDKVGPWKCPYHNGRMAIEILKHSKTV